MSRYEDAIVRYEIARLSVLRATNMISYWSARSEQDEECSRRNFNDESCIEKLWHANRNNKAIEEGDGYDCLEYIDPPPLCSACRNTQRFIDLRKRRKQEFGAAKRKLSALAKTLITPTTKSK